MDSETKAVYKQLTEDNTKSKQWTLQDLLSTGSTLLNCAISDHPFGGVLPGEFIQTVGASSAGKTAWYMQLLAEACADDRFEDYRIYVDDPENGMLFDVGNFWGLKLKNRLKIKRSRTLEDMVDTIDDLCDKEKPFFYVIDSVDALFTRGEQDTYLAQKKARRTGKKEPGSYGTDKPKRLRAALRMLRHRIRKLKAVVILVFQETASFGYGANAESKTHGGGSAPKFFANLQMWFSIRKHLSKDIGGGVKMDQGILTRIKIKKNRISGKHRTIDLPFYYESGFDDVGSMVDFLIASKHWKKKGGKYNAHDLDLIMKRGSLIQEIENSNMEQDLKMIVGEVWKSIEEKACIKRKKRYD